MNISPNCDQIETFNGSVIWTYREMLQDLYDCGQFASKLEASVILCRAAAAAEVNVFEAKMSCDEWCDMVVAYQMNLPY